MCRHLLSLGEKNRTYRRNKQNIVELIQEFKQPFAFHEAVGIAREACRETCESRVKLRKFLLNIVLIHKILMGRR